MRRDSKILVLVLTIPLLLFGMGYAYAQQSTGTYVIGETTPMPAYAPIVLDADCYSGDYATGGGHLFTGPVEQNAVQSYPIPYTVPGTEGPQPTGWRVAGYNPSANPGNLEVFVVCQTPITVAGFGVPEFGSIYIIMIIGAAVYLVLTKMGKHQLKLVPTK